jgi:hypothetical protein
MQIALRIRDEKRELIPAAVHVDGSSRAQTVDRDDNELFWRLIDRFRQLTGIPVVLNTSFNRHGIPTISSPRQAIEHLLEGAIDCLAIGSFLIPFHENRIAREPPCNEVLEEKACLAQDCVRRLRHVLNLGSKADVDHYLNRLGDLLGLSVWRCQGGLRIGDDLVASSEDGLAKLMQLATESPSLTPAFRKLTP